MNRPLALLIAAGLASSAAAQSYTTSSHLSMPLSWVEVNGNNNGVLEPGESAEVRFDVSFTNQGGVGAFAPPVGTFTSGTILGLGSAVVDINGAGGTEGDFNNGGHPKFPYGVRTAWRLSGSSNGVLTGTGIAEIQFGQPIGAPSLALTTNPVNRMFVFLWTPATYAARTVTFSLAASSPPAVASLFLDLDGSLGAGVYVATGNLLLGSTSIAIVPGPAGAAALLLASLLPRTVMLRRRRRGGSP